MSDHDHRVDIREAMASRTFDIREALAGVDPETGEERDTWELLDEQVLDVTYWRDVNDPDAYRMEVLLSCGGPTERVDIDSRWACVDYSHSWGRNDAGEDVTSLELGGVDAEPWRQLGELYHEMNA